MVFLIVVIVPASLALTDIKRSKYNHKQMPARKISLQPSRSQIIFPSDDNDDVCRCRASD